jgi:hypothetical protein
MLASLLLMDGIRGGDDKLSPIMKHCDMLWAHSFLLLVVLELQK